MCTYNCILDITAVKNINNCYPKRIASIGETLDTPLSSVFYGNNITSCKPLGHMKILT